MEAENAQPERTPPVLTGVTHSPENYGLCLDTVNEHVLSGIRFFALELPGDWERRAVFPEEKFFTPLAKCIKAYGCAVIPIDSRLGYDLQRVYRSVIEYAAIEKRKDKNFCIKWPGPAAIQRHTHYASSKNTKQKGERNAFTITSRWTSLGRLP